MLTGHGDERYPTSVTLGALTQQSRIRVEHRRIGPGRQNAVSSRCTELKLVLSGCARVSRSADGDAQDGCARPGSAWLVPARTAESRLELDGPLDVLLVYFPPTLLEEHELASFGIEQDSVRLRYAGNLSDPVLNHLGEMLQGMIGRMARPTDRALLDGVRTSLAAHLMANYAPASASSGRGRKEPSLHPERLARVLRRIETRLAEEITLDDLAAEACLSQYHFARLFRRATGSPPLRYVAERRIHHAREMLVADDGGIAGIALDTGFSSQASFSRVFRKMTGLTPSQYRHRHRRTRAHEDEAGLIVHP